MLHALGYGKVARVSVGRYTGLAGAVSQDWAGWRQLNLVPLFGHDAWRDPSLKPQLCFGLEEIDDSVPKRRVWM